jgi:hypothetical protein
MSKKERELVDVLEGRAAVAGDGDATLLAVDQLIVVLLHAAAASTHVRGVGREAGLARKN